MIMDLQQVQKDYQLVLQWWADQKAQLGMSEYTIYDKFLKICDQWQLVFAITQYVEGSEIILGEQHYQKQSIRVLGLIEPEYEKTLTPEEIQNLHTKGFVSVPPES